LFLFLSASFSNALAQAQQLDEASIIRRVDAVVKARFETVLSFTVLEHYAVYRDGDQSHPAAEMTVRTSYNKDTGKSYTILSHSGSGLIQHFVLESLLDSEKKVNEPGTREVSWFTSDNYEMKLKPGGVQQMDGRDCLAVSMNPRRKAPNMIEGTLWVDARDFSAVRIEGTSSKSPSLLTGPAHVMRQYLPVDGFPQAIHARAESDSALFGKTIVTIDYQNYEIKSRPAK
jgi:hypothetical protein